MKFLTTLVATLLFSSSLAKDFEDEVADAIDLDDVEDAPEEEDGMIWNVHQSVNHERDYFEGFIVGFYHDPYAKVGEQCFKGKAE